ncbi:hypothetical protein F5888DRAFT_1633021 [Russula emetica]|nr:hypothetical protein F5888DRAFT_1633021 [Russula emetica]
MASQISSPNDMALYFLAIELLLIGGHNQPITPLADSSRPWPYSSRRAGAVQVTSSSKTHPAAPDSDVGTDVWINVALWFLGWIPGVIHAWWIIAKPGPVGPVHV